MHRRQLNGARNKLDLNYLKISLPAWFGRLALRSRRLARSAAANEPEVNPDRCRYESRELT